MKFSDLLKKLRIKHDLTQEALARKADTSVGNIRNWEQGLRIPTFPLVVKLSKALEVDCTAFSQCEDVAEATEEPPRKLKKR